MTLPLHTDTFLPYMRDVARCERSLQDLGAAWRLIEASAKMNCAEEAQGILPIMKATQAGFGRLERELVGSLVGEKLGNVQAALGTQARFVIDIVVRNLFERTADVGFLATDRALCAFVAGQQTDADAVRARLLAYRQKYTVYNEILLLDSRGNVLVQLDPEAPVEGSTDPLIAQTLASDGHVETFRASDLRPGHRNALLYSRRMHHPATGAVIGLLVLSFDFHREMRDIFRSHRDADGRTNLMLLDAQGTVIASADERWIAPGSRVPAHTGSTPQVFIHEGREYLLQTCPASAYQGYPGPAGWQGQAMMPLNLAFSAPPRQSLRALDAATTTGLLTHARRFSPPLFEVMRATETIQRVVWNGQIISAGQPGEQQKLKAILEQISETGTRSNAVFSGSISDMYETVLDARLGHAASQARLLVDLLDRNLYERANDCRWWALTPQLRHTLAQPPAARDLPQAAGILDYVNSLYTVYRTLFLYDSVGRTVAASRQALDALDDRSAAVAPALLQRVLALPSDQAYAVSAFEASPFTPGEATYTYHAAIRHPDDERRVVGGIGIVFETARELQAMLDGCVDAASGARAFFVDRHGTVMASTQTRHPAGSTLPVPAGLLSLANGQHQASVVEFDGQYAVLGCAASPGYREFKVSDGYRDDVLSVVVVPLGAVQNHTGHARVRWDAASGAEEGAGRGSALQSYATFWSGPHLLALPATAVVEAVPSALLSAQTAADPSGRVGLLPPQPGSAVQHLVWVFDLAQLLGGAPTAAAEGEIVLVRHGLHTIGLLVDALHGVPEFAPGRRRPSPLSQPGVSLVTEIIQPGGQHPIIQLVDLPVLLQHLLPPVLPQ
ncbi:MAG: chemotaxis protein CheW [Hydrogenophaga sp.]|uniref:chemotaxis protein CheW n=1 Tax=Hydrogenophaga sp. TaxID=1904254 RepID=UPI003D9B89F7